MPPGPVRGAQNPTLNLGYRPDQNLKFRWRTMPMLISPRRIASTSCCGVAASSVGEITRQFILINSHFHFVVDVGFK